MNASLSDGGVRALSGPGRLRAVMGASAANLDPFAGNSILPGRWEHHTADILRDAVEHRHVAYVDDQNLMKALMEHAQPSLPPPVPMRVKNREIPQSTECQQYLKNLARAIEEGVAKKRRPRLRSASPSKEGPTTATTTSSTTATMAPVVAGGTGTGGGAVQNLSTETSTVVPPQSEEKGALQMWEQEQEQEEAEEPYWGGGGGGGGGEEEKEKKGQGEQRSLSGGSFVCNSTRSLLNTIARGRFPMHSNASLSEVVRNWGKRKETRGENFMTSKQTLETHSKLLERLKQEPVRSWRVIHDLSTDPPSSPPIADRQRKSYDASEDCKIVEKWRHRFDYVNYADQFKIDDSLAVRDRCRHMVIRHETTSTGQPPLTALQNTFNEKNTRPFTAPSRPVKPNTGGDCVKSSVWMRRANEIALEREREHLITEIRRFELREAAASLSREAVETLRDDLIKLLMLWPRDPRKRHIFTKKNFVKWMRGRQNLPSTVGVVEDSAESISLAESMDSRAEAAFIEHVFSVLPGGRNTQ
ncbi:putative DNA repair protein RAD2 [Trypanosoma theileri]|uniref:Putative DNA repair protein RAD2 n=1 Tax=Trypanosoma theileri TaxID=67003 RepID=A0A1X0P540_9TRYP|nr:putative DNA repair protein RAD2 [Trypanosoma theileri]ORC91948.1 putative DNA repair protein RAD2 [Trypanosoma theileri]